jgi:hypothetical protein
MYRAHRAVNGPWWFSSSGDGRFDLAPPDGTCYLAFAPCTAIREAAGETLVQAGWVSAVFAADRCVSRLTAPRTTTLADTSHDDAAQYGLTCELGTITPYTLARVWAQAFAQTFRGLVYQSRFTTGSTRAVALFHAGGVADWEPDVHPEPYVQAAGRCGIKVASPVRAVTIISTPSPPRR